MVPQAPVPWSRAARARAARARAARARAARPRAARARAARARAARARAARARAARARAGLLAQVVAEPAGPGPVVALVEARTRVRCPLGAAKCRPLTPACTITATRS